MFDKLSNNLNLLMANARINASELARKTGVPASTIKKIRNDDNPNPTLTTLIPIARHFNATLSELVGDIPLQWNQPTASTYLPLLTWATATEWPHDQAEMSKISNEYHKDSFALIIEEDHWEGFPKGSVIIIDPSERPQHRQYVLVHKEGASIPALRQIIHDDDQRYLKPVMTGFEISPLTPQHRIIGTVVEVRQQFITHKG